MVRIEYSPDPTKETVLIYDVENVATFLRQSNFTREELLDLGYYKTDLLGDEIDTSDGSFLFISKLEDEQGCIFITHKSKIPEAQIVVPMVIAFAVSFVAALLIKPPGVPDVASRKQVSSTNSLSESRNEPCEPGSRIDDILGLVSKHTPKFIQYPYRIGVDNKEVEVMLTLIGRGKYAHDDNRVFDGDTQIKRIPNAAVNFYEPGTHPGKGSPYHTIGGLIDEKIGIYRQPNDLNPSELLPPNDLDVAAVQWRITTTDNGDGTYTVEFFGSNAETEEIDLNDYFAVGEDVNIRDVYKTESLGSKTLYYYGATPSDYLSKQFNEVQQINLSGTFEVESLTNTRFTFTTSDANWNGLSNYAPVSVIYFAENEYPDSVNNYVGFFTSDGDVSSVQYYSDPDEPPAEQSRISVSVFNRYPSVGSVTNNLVGPVTVSKDVTELIFNFTSVSGFFKLVKNNERSIQAQVEVIYDELDENGDVIPGTTMQIPFDYNSNEGNVRFSVYQTKRVNIVDVDNDIRIYCRRLTNRDKSSNTSNNDTIEWTSIFTFEPISDNHDFGDVSMAHWYIPSNSQSQLTNQRKSNLDVTRKITQYFGNGQFGPKEGYPTDNAFQCMIHASYDPWIGRLAFDQMNADNLLLLNQQELEYFGDPDMVRFGYNFDNTEVSFQDTFKLICDVVNCIPYVQFGVYDAFFERHQSTSKRQITHRNKIPGSEKRKENYYMKYDGVELSYRDNESSISETVVIPDDGSATNPHRIELPGCTTELQAFRKAYREYQKQSHEYIQVDFDCDDYGKTIVPGARLDSPDGTRFTKREGVEDGYRVYDGEIVEVSGLVVELSQPVEFTDGEDHYIRFTKSDGTNGEVILCTPGEDEFKVVMSEVPSEPLYDGYLRDKSKYVFCSEQSRDSIALIPRTISSKIEDGKEIFTITSVNYSHDYYNGDTEYPQ